MAEELFAPSSLILVATLLAALSGVPLLLPRLLSAAEAQLV